MRGLVASLRLFALHGHQGVGRNAVPIHHSVHWGTAEM